MASSGNITVTIHGLDDLRGKLVGSKADAPIGRFLDRGAIFVQGAARKKAPVDRGRLRNSIGVEATTTRTRRIGPNAIGGGGRNYGEDVEFGTKPHMPPAGALDGWAKRHGFKDGMAVALIIARHGTKAQPYMQPAAEEAEGYLASLVPVLAAEIESAYQ